MTAEPTPAERFNANLGLTNSPAATAAPSGDGAPPPGGQEYATSWGPTRDPAQAWAALQGNPDYMRALMDGGNVAHKEAVAKRSELFQAMHGEERGDTLQGEGSGNMSSAIHEGHVEPTEAEMQAAYTSTATSILERQGVDAETAQGIAQLAVGAGLSTLDVSTVADGIASARPYSDAEQAREALGDNAKEIIRVAQAEANRLKLPAELLNMEIGDICLGEHPSFVMQLYRRARAG